VEDADVSGKKALAMTIIPFLGAALNQFFC